MLVDLQRIRRADREGLYTSPAERPDGDEVSGASWGPDRRPDGCFWRPPLL